MQKCHHFTPAPGGGAVDIERNDSGLGSETSKQRPAVIVRTASGVAAAAAAATASATNSSDNSNNNPSLPSSAEGRRRQGRGSYRNRILVDGGGGGGGVGGVPDPQSICEDCDQPITEENSEKDRSVHTCKKIYRYNSSSANTYETIHFCAYVGSA